MAAPKGNNNAAITDGTIPYTPNPRVRCLPEQVDIIRDMSPAERGRAMAEWGSRRKEFIYKARFLIATYAPELDFVNEFIAECDELLGTAHNGQGDE